MLLLRELEGSACREIACRHVVTRGEGGRPRDMACAVWRPVCRPGPTGRVPTRQLGHDRAELSARMQSKSRLAELDVEILRPSASENWRASFVGRGIRLAVRFRYRRLRKYIMF